MSETPTASEGDQERRVDDLAAARREIPRPLAGSGGLISSINVSHPGGVPKRPIDRTTITIHGLNLTVSGLDLGGLREGDRLRIGPAESGPIIQLSEPAAPCKNIAGSFEDWRIARVSHKVRPEDSRWYARVLREGPVVTGDRIELLGAADTIGQ